MWIEKMRKISSNINFDDQWNQIPSVVWNEKWALLYYVYHYKYIHCSLNSNEKNNSFFKVIINNIIFVKVIIQTSKG
jgi:hypothetical protein